VLVVASIEAPFVFLEKPIKILLFYPVKLPQITFRLVPKILNAIDMIMAISEEL
jgi:hypothetical protein